MLELPNNQTMGYVFRHYGSLHDMLVSLHLVTLKERHGLLGGCRGVLQQASRVLPGEPRTFPAYACHGDGLVLAWDHPNWLLWLPCCATRWASLRLPRVSLPFFRIVPAASRTNRAKSESRAVSNMKINPPSHRRYYESTSQHLVRYLAYWRTQ